MLKTGKEHCKFNGNPEELDSFLKSVLKLKGNWSQTKNPLNHKISKTEYAAISWWKSTKTLSVSGKCEDDIRQQQNPYLQKQSLKRVLQKTLVHMQIKKLQMIIRAPIIAIFNRNLKMSGQRFTHCLPTTFKLALTSSAR